MAARSCWGESGWKVKSGMRRDIQLKGSAARRIRVVATGVLGLGPVLREYVLSRAMHALGIRNTRVRLGSGASEKTCFAETALPGAVLTRVAASHLRRGVRFRCLPIGARPKLRRIDRFTPYRRHYPQADGL